jgi:eukaryotic-like serine/threonine-protein kinase
MTLAAGARLGPYEILSALGAGGMGEVYRARDTKLNRDVAIKILPEQFAADPERIARFAREAQVLASLNHHNIGGIYGLEEAGGVKALVMELVEGPTLADRIAQGPIPLDEALPIARQIAEALEAAHELGIIHRDLKPANIKLRPDGTVKVLDFGLAKALTPDAGSATKGDLSQSPTITTPAATRMGVIMGTAAYMSPEQARGRAVDKRADIWAFGCVLYEMVTGRRPFQGEDITETIAAVVKDQPDFAQVPATVRRLLKSCLEKDPKKRLQAIGDMRLLLEDTAPVTRRSRPQLGTAAWAVASVAVLGAALLAFIHFREIRPKAPIIRSTILPPANTTLDFAQGVGLPALSPDGQRIVFGARTADGKTPLWVRALDGLAAQPLAGTEGATFPFWSPDSRFIAFFADGKLKKIDASGGPALTLADARLGRGGSWSRDGVIVFAPGVGDPLQRVPSAGGASSPVSTEPGSFPWFLPDGRHFVYQGGRSAIKVGSLDGSPSQAVGTGSNALYAQGHLLFLREDTLMAQRFDEERLATVGEAVPVAERVQTVLDSGRVGAFSVSETGLLAYREGAGSHGGILTWFDRSGNRGTAVGEVARQALFEFSPDRTRVAAVVQDQAGAGEDVWIYDVARGLRTRFTFDAARDTLPVWSPDGRSIVFSSNRKGNFDLYRKAVDSVGAEELLYADDLNKRPTSWSADRKLLLYDAVGPNSKTGRDIWVLPLPERPGVAVKPSLVLQTAFNEGDARFSADGRWILYSSDESQRYEVYVTPFPLAPSGPGGKRQVSTSGTGPVGGRWRQDGREIFYVSQDRRLMATEVAIKGGTLEAGAVSSPFSLISEGGNVGLASFDVSADGQRFLVSSAPEQQSAEPLTLILNWASGLNK